MNTTTASRTQNQRITDTIYRVRELSESPAFAEDVERKVRMYRNHSDGELNQEFLAWQSIYQESLENGAPHTAKHALADIQAIGKVLDERGDW